MWAEVHVVVLERAGSSNANVADLARVLPSVVFPAKIHRVFFVDGDEVALWVPVPC
jgi:hypothetical protein